MKLIKLGLISVFVLFIIFTAIGLLLPSKTIVSRVVEVNTSKQNIYPLMANLNLWKKWIEGMNNEHVRIECNTSGNLNGVLVTITRMDSIEIVSTWKGKKGSSQTSTMRLIANNTSNTTVVQWQFEEQFSWYPWERFGSMMNESMIGAKLEKNLSNLKTFVEQSTTGN